MNALVIDEGADLSHDLLKNNVNFNQKEVNGVVGVDDDKNGYVDDTAGWNSISNDGKYMPDYVLEKFTKDPSNVKKLFSIYSAYENGDPDARRQLIADPTMVEQVSELLGLAHGTHVAGIINTNSLTSSRLQSLNVFEGSEPESSKVSDKNSSAALGITFGSVGSYIKRIWSLMNTQPTAHKSFLDDTATINKVLAKTKESKNAQTAALSKYLQASKSKVVNLSLGMGKKDVRENIDEVWAQELADSNLDAGTPKTAAQEANYQLVVNGLYSIVAKSWGALFAANPDVLFVIAAANDGKSDDAAAGNLDINPVTPADQSINYPNVITIAATDKEGVITDFSCFSATLVNIGAWGKAVPSSAPGQQMVSMSGTSMASPLVAGVATRVRAINPKLTAVETRTLIERTGRKLAALTGKVSTGAVIDADAAFLAAQNSTSAPLSLAVSDVLKSRVSNRARINNNMLDLGTSALTLNLDTTYEGQISETPDLVKSMMRKFDMF